MNEDVMFARAALSRFSPERPLWVGAEMMKAMRARPEIADLMDRVRVCEPLLGGEE